MVMIMNKLISMTISSFNNLRGLPSQVRLLKEQNRKLRICIEAVANYQINDHMSFESEEIKSIAIETLEELDKL